MFSSCNPFATSDLNKWVRHSNKYFSIQILEGFENYLDEEERTALGNIPQYSIYWRNSALFINDLGLKSMELSYFEIPKAFKSKSSQWILEACTQFFIRKQSFILSYGRVIENKQIFLNDFPGRSVIACEDVGKDDSMMVFKKLFIAHSRVYILQANGYISALNQPAINRFMQSFRLRVFNEKKPFEK